MATRAQNETKFKHRRELPDGGRAYWIERKGRVSGFQRFSKEGDASEKTTRCWQEVYDNQNRLLEIHEKYPVDKGHQRV